MEVWKTPVTGFDRFRKADIQTDGMIEFGDALLTARYNVGLRDVWFKEF